MTSVKIKKLYLENYKLFSKKEIHFTNGLNIFNGPNGYGKTSIFDAIELLITGEINRIKDCNGITGTLSYKSNFLAQDTNKDVIIKGDFASKSGCFSIGKIIPSSTGGKSKNYNPKNLSSITKTYLLPNYEEPIENWEQYIVSCVDLPKIMKDKFGSQSVDFFTLLHYIQQENRLSFFQQTENSRTKDIEKLFRMEAETNKQEQIAKLQRKLINEMKIMKTAINEIETKLKSSPEASNKKPSYQMLVNGILPWDQEEPNFKGIDSKVYYEQLQEQVKGVGEFLKWKNTYGFANPLLLFSKLDPVKQKNAILDWAFIKKFENNLDQLSEMKRAYQLLQDQKELVDEQNFIDLNYKALLTIIEKQELYDSFSDLAQSARKLSKNLTNLQESINNIIRIRDQLHEKTSNINNVDKACPYCGYNWPDHNKLEMQFSQTGQLLKKALGSENSEYQSILEKLKGMYQKECKELVAKKLKQLHANQELQLFLNLGGNSQEILKCYHQLQELLDKLNLKDFNFQWEDDFDTNQINAGLLVEQLLLNSNRVPAAYIETDHLYNFPQIYKNVFKGNSKNEIITENTLKEKSLYLTWKYSESFNSDRDKLNSLNNQYSILVDIYNQMKNYSAALKSALDNYRVQLISQIEIPFFLYSSRILQSYQCGQGILIKSDGASIRFTAPGAEHDVLYTMSSGQLSAMLLSFSLALNKIYGSQSLQTIFIDDPIQCMDDINIISFIEVLRSEFSSSQLIISTHEDVFSKYILYKYKKFNLSAQSIRLKDQ